MTAGHTPDQPHGPSRRTVRRALIGALVGAVGSVGLAACSVSSTPPTPTTVATPGDPDPSAVVSALGAVPIPPSSAPVPTPSASAGHPVLSAAGQPVAVSFGPHAHALVTLLGPEQAGHGAGGAPGVGPQKQTRAVLTLQLRQTTSGVRIGADELSSRDQTGHTVLLRTSGPRTVTTRAGHTSTLAVLGTFDGGSAQVTWRHKGHVLAIWAFTIELD